MAKYAQNGLKMHLLQSRLPERGETSLSGSPPLGPSGARFVPPALNSPPTL
jgi:hypothetical protein